MSTIFFQELIQPLPKFVPSLVLWDTVRLVQWVGQIL